MVDKVETPVEAIKKEADMLQAMVWRPKLRFWSTAPCGFDKKTPNGLALWCETHI